MVATPQKQQVDVVEIPISKIKVANRLRGTSAERIADLATSIKGIMLLHPITVSKKDDGYLLLSGHHRIEAFKLLGRSTIPATIHEGDELVEQLVEVEENLCRQSLDVIQTADHIVKREDLLTQLGQRAAVGQNQWSTSGLTNADLARSIGCKTRSYQYKKSVASLHPEVKDLLSETNFANNLMDMVALSKESDEVQLAVANLLATGKCSTFKRSLTLARCQVHSFEWKDEQIRIKDLVGKPKSVMKWTGESSSLSKLCKLVSHAEDTQVIKQSWGTQSSPLAAMHPDHSAYLINYYTEEGDVVADVMAGRGTNVLVAAALGRKVVGYDLSEQNLQTMREVAEEHTPIEHDDLTLHHSCGIKLAEYSDQENVWDLVTFDPPYFHAETYGSDERDLCKVRDLDAFNERMEECLSNLKRLIKPSNFKQRIFHPIAVKVGSSRSSGNLIDMATEVEIIGRKLNLSLHDKLINVLDSHWSMFNLSRCLDHRYAVKVHETTLVFCKYE